MTTRQGQECSRVLYVIIAQFIGSNMLIVDRAKHIISSNLISMERYFQDEYSNIKDNVVMCVYQARSVV